MSRKNKSVAAADKSSGGSSTEAFYDMSLAAWQGRWSTDIAAIVSVSQHAVARYFVSTNRIDVVECKSVVPAAPSLPSHGFSTSHQHHMTSSSSATFPPAVEGDEAEAGRLNGEEWSRREADFLASADSLCVNVAEVGSINLVTHCGLKPSEKLLSMHTFTVEDRRDSSHTEVVKRSKGNKGEEDPTRTNMSIAEHLEEGKKGVQDSVKTSRRNGDDGGVFSAFSDVLPCGTYLLCLLKDDSSHYLVIHVTSTNRLVYIGRGRFGEGKDFFSSLSLSSAAACAEGAGSCATPFAVKKNNMDLAAGVEDEKAAAAHLFRPTHIAIFGHPTPHYGLGYCADTGAYIIFSLVTLVLNSAKALKAQMARAAPHRHHNSSNNNPAAGAETSQEVDGGEASASNMGASTWQLPSNVESALSAYAALSCAIERSLRPSGISTRRATSTSSAATTNNEEETPSSLLSQKELLTPDVRDELPTRLINALHSSASNFFTAVIIQRGSFAPDWSDVMWKGTPYRYSTRQKFFAYDAVSGACCFEAVRIDRRYVLLAEGEEVSFPLRGDKALMSSDNTCNEDDTEGHEEDIEGLHEEEEEIENKSKTEREGGEEGESTTQQDQGREASVPPRPPVKVSGVAGRRSLASRMAHHRRSVALLGTQRLPPKRRGCLLIPVNLNKQVGCLLYSHNFLSVPHGGRSTGLVPRISRSRDLDGGQDEPSTSFESATALLQKRIFAHDEPWTSCVFLTNAAHNHNEQPYTNRSKVPPPLAIPPRSYLMTYCRSSGTVWVSQIHRVLNNARPLLAESRGDAAASKENSPRRARRGTDVALPSLFGHSSALQYAQQSSSPYAILHGGGGGGGGGGGQEQHLHGSVSISVSAGSLFGLSQAPQLTMIPSNNASTPSLFPHKSRTSAGYNLSYAHSSIPLHGSLPQLAHRPGSSGPTSAQHTPTPPHLPDHHDSYGKHARVNVAAPNAARPYTSDTLVGGGRVGLGTSAAASSSRPLVMNGPSDASTGGTELLEGVRRPVSSEGRAGSATAKDRRNRGGSGRRDQASPLRGFGDGAVKKAVSGGGKTMSPRPASGGRAQLEQWRRSPTTLERSGRDVHLYDEARDELGTPFSVRSRFTNESDGRRIEVLGDDATTLSTSEDMPTMRYGGNSPPNYTIAHGNSGHGYAAQTQASRIRETEGVDARRRSSTTATVPRPFQVSGGGEEEDKKARQNKITKNTNNPGTTVPANTSAATNGENEDEEADSESNDSSLPRPIKVSLASLLASAAASGGDLRKIAAVTDSEEVAQMLADRRKARRKRGSYVSPDDWDYWLAEGGIGGNEAAAGGARGSPPKRPSESVENKGKVSNRQRPAPPSSPNPSAHHRPEPTRPRAPKLRSGLREERYYPVAQSQRRPLGPEELGGGARPVTSPHRSKALHSSSDPHYDENGRRIRTRTSHSPPRESGKRRIGEADIVDDVDDDVDPHAAAARRRQQMYVYKIPTRPRSARKSTVPLVSDSDSRGASPADDDAAGGGDSKRFRKKLKASTPRLMQQRGQSLSGAESEGAASGESSPKTKRSKCDKNEDGAEGEGDGVMNSTIPANFRKGASTPMFAARSSSSSAAVALPATTDNFHEDIIAIIKYLQDSGQIPAMHKKAVELALEKVYDMEEGDDDGGLLERPEYKHAGVIIATPFKPVASRTVAAGHLTMASEPDRHSATAKFERQFAKKRETEIANMIFKKKTMELLHNPLHKRLEFQEQQIKKMLAPHQKIQRITKQTYEKLDPTQPEPPVNVKKQIERLAEGDIKIRLANLENKKKQREKEAMREVKPPKVLDAKGYTDHVTRVYDEAMRIRSQTLEKLIKNRDRGEQKLLVGADHKTLTPRDEKALAERLIDRSIQRKEALVASTLKEMDKAIEAHRIGKHREGPLTQEEIDALSSRLCVSPRAD